MKLVKAYHGANFIAFPFFLLSTHFLFYDFDLRASHARTLLPAALASVPLGFVLVVRVRVAFRFCLC